MFWIFKNYKDMWKLVKNVFFVVIYFYSINSTLADYLPKDVVIKLDNDHHNICVKKFSTNADRFLELYWNCRVEQIENYKDTTNFKKDLGYDYKKEISEVKKVVKYRQQEAMDLYLQKTQNRRFKQTIFLEEDDWYYFNLIQEKFTTDLIYLEQLEIKEKQKEKEDETEKAKKIIREAKCVKYKKDSPEHNRCVKLFEAIDICLSTLEESINEKEMEYKFFCKKEAVKTYPDDLVLYNNEYQRLMNLEKDKYVIDRENDKKIEARKKELTSLMSGPKLSKIQLIELRKDKENQCIVEKQKDLELFKSILTEQCGKLEEKNK